MQETKVDPSRDWTIEKEDLQRARKILKGEVLNDINRVSAYEALVFAQLSHKQYYTTQVRTFVKLKEYGLTNPVKMISDNKLVEEVVRRHGSVYKQKARYLANSAMFWLDTDYPDRLVHDANHGRKKCEELRDEVVDGITGVGYKLASLFFLKIGHQTISIDRWLLEFMEHKGINEKLGIDVRKGSVPANKYKAAEYELKKLAGEMGITPAELCAAAWSKYSTWNSDDMKIYLRAISK